ncbi:MAG: peptide ABC transporter ATP-binding protein [Chloroflexi bacterium]|nr:MAG: peptide ABC transporter ATP-binding protein [Chloroflexota bacterium]
MAETTNGRGQREPVAGAQAGPDGKGKLLLEVTDLKMHFPIRKGFLRRTVGYVKAVDGVSFSINRGDTFGLVGESGCGKSTTGRCIIRLLDPTGGKIVYHDKKAGPIQVDQLAPREMRTLRRDMQIMFQDPYSSLNPRLTLKQIVGEPLVINNICRGKELEERVAQLLRSVGLSPEYMNRYPHAFSGGQRQRIGLARALALNPEFIVADEPVSALDVSVQAQVLNLIEDLQEQLHLTYLFIAHNMSVIKHVCDHVGVMYVGKIVEIGETKELFANPLHPYTEALLSAIPKPDPRSKRSRIILEGDVPNPANPPSGCYFHPRCRYAKDVCAHETPALREITPGHLAACHFADELQLRGAVEPATRL